MCVNFSKGVHLRGPPTRLVFLLGTNGRFASVFRGLITRTEGADTVRGHKEFNNGNVTRPSHVLIAQGFGYGGMYGVDINVLNGVQGDSLTGPEEEYSIAASSLPKVVSNDGAVPSEPDTIEFTYFSLAIYHGSLDVVSPRATTRRHFKAITCSVTSYNNFSRGYMNSDHTVDSYRHTRTSSGRYVTSTVQIGSPSYTYPDDGRTSIVSLRVWSYETYTVSEFSHYH